MKKQIATVFGIIGYAAILLGSVYLFRDHDHLFRVYAFLTIGAICSYAFLLFTQSQAGVIAALVTHILGIVSLYFAGSILYFSIPYLLLPFTALMVRALWMDKLGYSMGLWIEPTVYLAALGLYGLEMATNKTMNIDAKLFPLAFFLVNGIMVGDVLLDGLKIKSRVKQGYGLGAGDEAPKFTLQNENNENVSLDDFKDKHHVLLIFVRGEWCPLCHIMLRTYMKESAQFKEKNVFLLVVGPDPTGVNKKMAQDLKLDFHILSDPSLKITHAYRLKIKAEHLLHASNYNDEKEVPLPASFLIDKHGKIRYCSNPAKIGEVVKLNDIFPVLQSLDKVPA